MSSCSGRAFTPVWTDEMRTFRDRNDLPFDPVDDANREAIDPYDVAFDAGAVGSRTSPSTRCPS